MTPAKGVKPSARVHEVKLKFYRGKVFEMFGTEIETILYVVLVLWALMLVGVAGIEVYILKVVQDTHKEVKKISKSVNNDYFEAIYRETMKELQNY